MKTLENPANTRDAGQNENFSSARFRWPDRVRITDPLTEKDSQKGKYPKRNQKQQAKRVSLLLPPTRGKWPI